MVEYGVDYWVGDVCVIFVVFDFYLVGVEVLLLF